MRSQTKIGNRVIKKVGNGCSHLLPFVFTNFLEEKMKQATFAYSFQGSSHIKKEENIENAGKKFPCQDRSFAGYFESSESTEKKDVTLFVKDNSNLFSRMQLPVELNPHKAAFSLVCVSDGHGGAAYFKSHKGAEFAIQTSIELLSESIDKIASALQEKNYAKLKKNISNSFVRRWIRKIMSDIANTDKDELLDKIKELEENNEKAAKAYKDDVKTAYSLVKKYDSVCKNPETENDENAELSSMLSDFTKLEIKSIYGCTAAVYFQIKDDPLWYAFKIGDSDFFASFDGEFAKPIADDPLCYDNVTTSLCDENAAKNFRFPEEQYLERIPETVFLSSDGVANSFTDEEYLKKFYTQLQFLYNEDGSFNSENNIKETLPQLSVEGSGDDITLAGIVSYDDSPDAKKNRRTVVKETAKKYMEEGKYQLIAGIFKPYLDRNESEFKYLIAGYDYVETTKLAKTGFNKDFLTQWDKTYMSLNAILNDINLLNKSITISGAIQKLHKIMGTAIDDDINNAADIKTQSYIDDLFTPFVTDDLNSYSYYKAVYEYKLLQKCYENGALIVFNEMFSKTEADLMLFANAYNFNVVDNAQFNAMDFLAKMHGMKSEYWEIQKQKLLCGKKL